MKVDALIRCEGCEYLDEDDNGMAICGAFGGSIYEVSESDCSLDIEC